MRKRGRHHEQSITVRKDGKWYVQDNVGKNKGAKLGKQTGYASEKEATAYAKKRSKEHGQLMKENASERPRKKTKKNKGK